MSDILIPRPYIWLPRFRKCYFCGLISRALSATHLIGFGASGGCDCTPAYVTGNRTSYITVTTDIMAVGYTESKLVDGSMTDSSAGSIVLQSGAAVSGKHITFTFSAPRKINEATWRQDFATTHGTWKWQKSVLNDGTWVDVGSSFTLGGTAQAQTELSTNTDGCLAYRLLGVSGNSSSTPWVREIEFKECAC